MSFVISTERADAVSRTLHHAHRVEEHVQRTSDLFYVHRGLCLNRDIDALRTLYPTQSLIIGGPQTSATRYI